MVKVRTGQAPDKMPRADFSAHFQRSYYDPLFDCEREAIARLEEIAWKAYCDSRKSPKTSKAGASFADPDYDLSDEWRATHEALAAVRQKDQNAPSRVLLICAASRNDGTCPGEMSKSFRLAKEAEKVFHEARVEVDLLDLSHLISDHGRKIHPCKACVSTAMPLCHWPCSCYPNHSLGQSDDWMAEIYERFMLAHGIMIVTPVYWGMAPSGLKLMMDRLVCADGGNPDPSSTSGKDPAKAKAIELKGWNYPKHLAGRVYGLVVHGDVADANTVREGLAGWLDWSGFISAGTEAQVDRFIGYFEPYATSHEALDKDEAIVEEARNVARAVSNAIVAMRAGRLTQPDADLKPPRQK
ncbi:MAG TPA: flavodoxin family protein [Rhizomicrobium sp.]|jgi:multimeric flavodoxin WrbA|nr:flavodoxin family protein [Rhizomicrobium sp.]